MRVLLTTLNSKYIHSNLAIRLLYQLNKKHKGLEWKEFTIKQEQDDVSAYCAAFDVVAFSCYIWNITQTLQLAQKIKALNPSVKILLGGPEVSYDWEEVIALDFIDHIITGEGEIPFSQFLDAYPHTENIPNLVSKKNGEIKFISGGGNFELANYSGMLPYAEDAAETLGSRVLYIETSRGCPYKCEFCLASLDNKVRYLPMQQIKDNLLYMMKHGKVIKFLDRTFNIKKDFTLEIFSFILENHRPGNIFQFEITADILHPDIIKFVDEKVPPGLFRFEIGIQSVNQEANLAVSRKQNFEKTKKIIHSVRHKVEIHLDLIVGLPYDDWENIKYSFTEVFKLFAPELQLGFLKFLKGTSMRDKEEHGYVFDPAPPYQLIESKYLSAAQLNDITALEHALEIYWNKKRATNTLKYITAYYDIFDFLLSLGKYFGTRREYHSYTMNDVYGIIHDFINKEYSADEVMKQLLAIDYYLSFKIKPREMIMPPLQGIEKQKALENTDATGKSKYLVLPLSFSFSAFEKNNEIVSAQENLVIRYTGTDHALIIKNPQPAFTWA
jgi:radical SAM superfamily enzyme YgiQ (UPF0313 family)